MRRIGGTALVAAEIPRRVLKLKAITVNLILKSSRSFKERSTIPGCVLFHSTCHPSSGKLHHASSTHHKAITVNPVDSSPIISTPSFSHHSTTSLFISLSRRLLTSGVVGACPHAIGKLGALDPSPSRISSHSSPLPPNRLNYKANVLCAFQCALYWHGHQLLHARCVVL